MQFLQAFIGGNALELTLDTGIILFVFIVVFFYGLRVRKKRLILFSLSFYGSIALLSIFPFVDKINAQFSNFNHEIISAGLFVGFLVFFYYVLSGSIMKIYLPIPKRKRNGFGHIVILSFVLSGLLVSFALSSFPSLFKVNISPVTQNLFLTDTARLIWLFAPIVALRIVARYNK